MANSNRNIQFSLSCNAEQPKKQIEALKKLEEDLLERRKQLIAAGETEGKSWDMVKGALRDTRKEIRSAEENFETLRKVITNLANSSMPQLKKAFKEGQKAISNMSENSADLKPMQQALQEIQRQMDIVSGKAKNVGKEIENIQDRTDGWISSAKRDMQNYIASLDDVDDHYKEQLKILGKLEAEEKRRADLRRASEDKRAKNELKSRAREAERRAQTGDYAGLSQNDIEAGRKAMIDYQKTLEYGSERWKDYGEAISKAEAHLDSFKNKQDSMTVDQAKAVVTNSDATSADLRKAKTTLMAARENVPTSDKVAINEYDKALTLIEDRLNEVNGKIKETSISWRKMREVLSNPNNATGEDIKKTMDALQQKIAKLPVGSKRVADLRAQYAQLERTLKGTESNLVNVEDVIKRSKQGKASISELKQAYKQLEEELQNIDYKSKEYHKHVKEMSSLRSKIDSVTNAVTNHGNSWNTALKNLTSYVGLFAVFNKIKDTVTSAIKKNFDYSASLTDIRKVSGLALKDVEELSRNLAKIDTRTTVEGLAQLAYQGSKLGMGKYGVEGLTAFVKAADQINVAIGEELGEEALPALSKLVETMGLIPKLGIEKAMLATGSAMFKLSTTSTATSNNIVEMSKRLTGVARTAGITTDQMLALASASDSLFLMPEVSATAFSKFIVALQKNHNLIEKDLGIQEGTIKQLYAAGNAMDAIVMVLEKMRDKGNMNALGNIFKDMGSDGQRLVTAMVTMSKNVDVLKDHLYESREAFEEATSVTKEYEMQQQSAIGILERANNLWGKAFVNPDGVNSVKSLAEAWYDISKTITESPLFKGTLYAALQSVIVSAKMLVVLLPALINFLLSAGLARSVMFFWELGKAIRNAVIAQHALNAAMKANIFGAVASVVLTAVGVIWSYVNAANEAAKAEEEAEKRANAWKDKLKEAQVQTDTITNKLRSYKVALENANLSEEERTKKIAQFNKDFRQYISKLGIEIKNVRDLTSNYKALSEEIQRATYYRMREEAKADALPGLQKDRLAAANKLKASLTDKRNLGRYDAWSVDVISDMIANGSNGNDVYKTIMRGVYGKDIKFNKDGTFSKKDSNGKEQGGFGDIELLRNLRWYANSTNRETNKSKEIDDYFGVFVPEDYVPYIEEEPGTLENDAVDKDALKNAKEQKREQERSWREELKQKQDDANAIIDNVRNFYERQINKKLEDAIALGMDKSEQELFVEPMKKRMNMALEQVRLAIAGQANTWETFKQTMREDLVEQADETGINLSEGLLEGITENNIDALRAKLQELGDNLSKPLNSILAEVFAKATNNAQANLKLESAQAEARRKEIQKHDYAGVVQRNAYDSFNTLGFANPTQRETSDKSAFDERKKTILDMFENARKSITTVFGIDVNSSNDRDLLLTLLFGKDSDMQKRVAETLGDSEVQWQLFYQKLIQYSDEYTEAEKKAADERKKVNDFLWSQTDTYKDYNNDMPAQEQKSAVLGSYRNAGQKFGMSDIVSNDPELEMIKMRMEFAQKYYDFLEKHHASEKDLAEARKSIMQSQAEYAKKLTSDMFEQYNALLGFTEPLQTFGASVGEAFGTMREDAAAGKKAIRDAVKQMVKSFATNTLNMISQQQIEQANTTAHYTALLAMQTAFGQAQIATENATGQAIIATKQANDSVEVNLESIKEQQMVALRSAGIFGWCVSTLGPIAGPIAYSGMMAILMGLLNYALSFIGGSSSSKSSNAASVNTKLVSGMLTYDNGNISDLKPFFDKEGNMYWAAEDDSEHQGVSLLTQPTATTINGQPSLVAEQGPELVIGRETTRAMMQNDPQLLRALYAYDRNHSGRHAYDNGNIQQALPQTAPVSGNALPDNTNTAQMNALLQALLTRLSEPITAKVDMYGRGNLYDSMSKANAFMKGK